MPKQKSVAVSAEEQARVSQLVKRKLEIVHITQRALADALGMSKPVLSKTLASKRRMQPSEKSKLELWLNGKLTPVQRGHCSVPTSHLRQNGMNVQQQAQHVQAAQLASQYLAMHAAFPQMLGYPPFRMPAQGIAHPASAAAIQMPGVIPVVHASSLNHGTTVHPYSQLSAFPVKAPSFQQYQSLLNQMKQAYASDLQQARSSANAAMVQQTAGHPMVDSPSNIIADRLAARESTVTSSTMIDSARKTSPAVESPVSIPSGVWAGPVAEAKRDTREMTESASNLKPSVSVSEF